MKVHSLQGSAMASGLIHLSLLALASRLADIGPMVPLDVWVPVEVVSIAADAAPAAEQMNPRALEGWSRPRGSGNPSPKKVFADSPQDTGTAISQAASVGPAVADEAEPSQPHASTLVADPPLPRPIVERAPDPVSRPEPPARIAGVAEVSSGQIVVMGQDKRESIDHSAGGKEAGTPLPASSSPVGAGSGTLATNVRVGGDACPGGGCRAGNPDRQDRSLHANGADGAEESGMAVGGVTDVKRLKGGYQVIPRYPESARRAGIEGTALLKLLVLADGGVASVTIARSAGHADLDHAAVQAIRRWRFEPARRDHLAVTAWVMLPVEFRLKRW